MARRTGRAKPMTAMLGKVNYLEVNTKQVSKNYHGIRKLLMSS